MTLHALRSRCMAGFLGVTGAAFLGLQACTPQGSVPADLPSYSIITEQEIDSAHVSTAYDAVHKLRPQFLMSRGKLTLNSSEPPALPSVYVDNMFYGDATTLRVISASTIESIMFYASSEAQQKFGRGNMAGALSITTKH